MRQFYSGLGVVGGEYILACPLSSKEKDSHGDFWSYCNSYLLYFHLVP
jgi:hypothetical protein